MLVADKFLGLQWDLYFTNNRTASSIIKKLLNFFLFLKNHYNITVKVIKANNKIMTVKL